MNTTTKAKILYWWYYKPKWFILSLFEKKKAISDFTCSDFKVNKGQIMSAIYKGNGYYDLSIRIDMNWLDYIAEMKAKCITPEAAAEEIYNNIKDLRK